MDMCSRYYDSTEEYLNQISRLNRAIDYKFLELTQLRELSISVTSILSGDKVQSSLDPDKIGNTCAKIVDMEEDINAIIDEFIRLKKNIISQIEGIDKEIYYEILFLRYVRQNKNRFKTTFEEISVEINQSYRNTTRLHKKALEAFEAKYGHEYLKKLQN